MTAGRDTERGAATTELVIAAPAFLFLLMLIVQAGLYFHAVNVASAAAQEGARTARLEGSSLTAGERDARQFVQAVAPRLLSGVDARGTLVDGGESVRITVSADVITVFRLPGVNLDWSVREAAEGPRERFRPATDTPPADDS